MKIVNSLVVTAILSTHVGAQHCKELDSEIAYVCPVVRYCDWNHYNTELQTQFASVGYDLSSWNSFDSADANGNELEDKLWSDLELLEQDTMGDLGYDEEQFNKCINHYTGFAWSALDSSSQATYSFLGYNETTWNTVNGTEMEYMGWDDYDEDAQMKLSNVGYNKESWDGDSLPWADSATYPGEMSCDAMANTDYACEAPGFETTQEVSMGFDGMDKKDLAKTTDEKLFDAGLEKMLKEKSGADDASVTGKRDGDSTRKKSLIVDILLETKFTCDGKCDASDKEDALAIASEATTKLKAALVDGSLLKGLQEAVSLDILANVTASFISAEDPVAEEVNAVAETTLDAIINFLLGILDFILGILSFIFIPV